MFSIPITVPFRDGTGVFAIDVTVNIDTIEFVNPLDRDTDVGVELDYLYDYRPMSELVLTDGRKLPVCEPPAIIERYLEAYRQIENFYTVPIDLSRGVVIPLFPKARPCASSEGSTPD